MSRPTLTINGKDARTTWGLIPGTKVLSALMAPPETKDPIINSSRLEDGVRITVPSGIHRYKERDISLDVAITAPNSLFFLVRYMSLLEELKKPVVELTFSLVFSHQHFRLCYKGCTQYTQYNHRLAKFILRFTEPNPTDRTVQDNG